MIVIKMVLYYYYYCCQLTTVSVIARYSYIDTDDSFLVNELMNLILFYINIVAAVNVSY